MVWLQLKYRGQESIFYWGHDKAKDSNLLERKEQLMKRQVLTFLVMASLVVSSSVYGEDITLNPEVVVPELQGMPIATDTIEDVASHPKGAELKQLTQYTDLGGSSYANEAARMTFEGVFKNNGSKVFNPKGVLSKQDVATLLVRMMGAESTVQQGVLSTAQGLDNQTVQGMLKEAYITQATTLGILTANEIGQMDEPATREDVAVWTARAINLQPDYQDVDGVYTYKDVSAVKPENKGTLEALLKEKIFATDKGGLFNPSRTVSRGEYATVLAEISPRLYTNRNLATFAGMVVGISNKTENQPGGTVTSREILLKATDGTMKRLTTTLDSQTGQRTEFGVYKGGRVTGSESLAVGDQMEVVTRDSQAVYAEVLNDGSIVKRLQADSVGDAQTRTYFGTIYSRIEEVRSDGDKSINIQRIRIKNHTGQTFDLIISTDPETGIKTDVFVLKNGTAGGAGLLNVGDSIEYVVKDPDQVVYIQANPAVVREVKGTLRNIEIPTEGLAVISVLDYNNAIGQYPVASYADISVNTGYATVGDLKYGMPCTLTLNNGFVTALAAETFVNPGYIDPNNRMEMGVVQSVDSNQVTITRGDGTTTTFFTDEGTRYRKSGEDVNFTTLRPGDRVKLYFAELYALVPSRIEIEGPEQLLTGVYTGKIKSVNSGTKAITLQNPMVYKNGQWSSTGEYLLDVYLSGDAVIFAGGKAVKIEDLKNYYGQSDVYVAIKDGYSRPEAVKLIVKAGGERLYSTGLNQVDLPLNQFELDNRINVGYNDGTIFIRDNRLVDPSTINTSDSVSIVTNAVGSENRAAVVDLNGTKALKLGGLWLGYVDIVYSNRIDLKYYSEMDGNAFTRVYTGAAKPLYYGTASRVRDVSDEDNIISLTPYTLFNGSYSMEENEDTNGDGLDFERFYGIAYLDPNGEVVDMLLRQKELFKGYDLDDTVETEGRLDDEINDQLESLVITKGTVAGMDTDWSRLQLRDSYDWINVHNTWNQNRTDTYIEISETLVVKNNKPITFEEIQTGDKVQVVRLREDAVLVVVEE